MVNNKDNKKLSFDEEKGLVWPINGNIIKSYSIDKLVYFPTLEVFKVNPAVFIEGKENINIKSACNGIIKKIDQDTDIGKYVEVEIGNGYVLVYGQLKDILVNEGDDIKEGEVFAKLSKPTDRKSTRLNSSHTQKSRMPSSA